MKIGDLFIALGLKVDQEKLARFQKGINNLQRDIVTLKAAFIAGAFALDRFVDGTVKGNVSLQNLSNQTGLAIDKLQRLNQVGQLADLTLSADTISQSIGNLERNLAAIRLGQGNIAPFQLLGIDPAGKDAFQILDRLRESIKGLDPATATNLIQQLGLTPQFINILKLSRKEFEALSENTFLNKNQRQNIIRLGTAITGLRLRFKALKDQAVAKLTPLLIEMVEKFFKWMRDNGDKIINTIAGLARGITLFVQAIGRSVGLLGEFIEKLLGVENGIKVITVAVSGLLAAVLIGFRRLGRLILFGVIIGLLEDIAVWHKGGESAFGKVYDVIANGLSKVTDWFKIAFRESKAFFEATISFTNGLMDALKSIQDFFSGGIFEKIDDLSSRVGSLFGGAIPAGATQEVLEKTFSRIPSINPAESAGGTSSSQNTTNNISVVNNIDGAQSPQVVADEVLSGISAQLNNGAR